MQKFMFLILGLGSMSGFGAAPLASSTGLFRIFYTANRQGEVDPCGCQVNQLGGISRMKALLDRELTAQEPQSEKKLESAEQDATPLFVDAGDTFFSSDRLNDTRKTEETERALLIARIYRLFRVDAISPGERDLAAGVARLRTLGQISGATLLSANLTDAEDKLLFKPFEMVKRGGFKVALIGISDEKAFERISEVRVRPVEDSLRNAIESVRKEKPDFIVVLSHLGLVRDRQIAKSGAFSSPIAVVVGAHSMDVLSQPAIVGKTLIVQSQDQGQQLGILDLDAKDFTKSHHSLVDLGTSYEKPNEVRSLVESFKAKVRDLAVHPGQEPANQGATEAKGEEGKPYVAHPTTCRTCHQAQYEFWKTTKHASAYLVLYAKNQHFDPACIACHSLGFQRPEGFKKIANPFEYEAGKKPPKKSVPFIEQLMQQVFEQDPKKGPLDSRTDPERYALLKKRYHETFDKLDAEGVKRSFVGVQCENCHGNRNGHPSPTVITQKKVPETTCRSCHRAPNAPDFDPSLLSKVACPLRANSQ